MPSVEPSGWLRTLSSTAFTPVGGDDVEDRLRSALHPGEVAHAHHLGATHDDAQVLDLGGRPQPAVHDGEVEGVVLLVHAGRGDQVVPLEGARDVAQGQARGVQPHRVHHHVVLRRAAAHEVDPRDAGDAQEARLQLVARGLPETRDVALRAGQADAEDGKGREGEPPDRRRRRRRQLAADLAEAAQHVELRLLHVDFPVEEDVHLRGAAPGRRTHLHDTRDVFHRFFDRPGDGGHHLVAGHDAVVDQHDAPREVRLREDGGRHLVGRVDPGHAQALPR